MSLITKLNKLQLSLQALLMVFASVFIVVGVSAMAIMRYVFESNLYGAEEVILIAAFWLYFLGAGSASEQRKHIRAEVFSAYCKSEKINMAVKALAESITLCLSVIYTYWAVEFIIRSFESGGVTPVWRIPMVTVHLSILIGFILITIYSAIDLKQTVKKICS
jgi:TRAP-type C4-dicarboxylate transport system permease small subunit